MNAMSKGTLAIGIALSVVSCAKGSDSGGAKGGKGKGGGGKLAYPVEIAPLVKRPVVYSVSAPGSIDAYQYVQITARVAGAVDKVAFLEGQSVKANDVLVTIEPDRYQVAVEQANSALAKAVTTEKSAQAALDRRQQAQKDSPGLVAGEEIEEKAAAVDSAKADVEAAKEALHVAQINLRDSSVRAPIDGVVQTRTVQLGQYLQAGAVLATIIQRDPMLLRFQVTEQDAPRMKVGDTASLILKESPRSFDAKIVLVGGEADPTTRLVPVTAQITTTEHQYWLRPGAFCEVTVPIGDARQGIVVPTLAVEPTEQGNVVFVVDDKNIAHQVTVQLGMHTPDGGVEITQGLSEGQKLVVRGMEPLSDNAPVEVKDTTSLAAAQAQVDGGVPQVTAPPVVPAGGGGSGSGSAAAGSAGSAGSGSASGGGSAHGAP